MELKPGQRVSFDGTELEVIVIAPPGAPVDLVCESGDDAAQLGKRYVDEDSGLEVLCVKPGTGSLHVDGRSLVLKGAKPLPSSD